MKLNEVFNYHNEYELRRFIHIQKADTLDKLKSVKFYDDHTARTIAELREAIELLEEYRKTLYTRYQEIISAPFKLVLRLERTVNYDGYKNYIITLVKRFEGAKIADEEVMRESFTGKDRSKALKRFEELKKEYPTTETETDIEKKRWEK
jgi:hypothetical protein